MTRRSKSSQLNKSGRNGKTTKSAKRGTHEKGIRQPMTSRIKKQASNGIFQTHRST